MFEDLGKNSEDLRRSLRSFKRNCKVFENGRKRPLQVRSSRILEDISKNFEELDNNYKDPWGCL